MNLFSLNVFLKYLYDFIIWFQNIYKYMYLYKQTNITSSFVKRNGIELNQNCRLVTHAINVFVHNKVISLAQKSIVCPSRFYHNKRKGDDKV